jgi:hypothetical protein
MKDELKAIIMARWKFIFTPSMSFAYLLSPRFHCGFENVQEKFDAVAKLKQYIGVYYESNSDDRTTCLQELEKYLEQFAFLNENTKQEICEMDPKSYWGIFGRDAFPLLGSIAVRLFSIPTSSAASERVWKVFSSIHTKKRNRLLVEKVEKLAFITINEVLLDEKDLNVYVD